MKDIFEADLVEITVDQFGKIWVNIDGACAMRIGRAKIVVMDDPSRGQDVVYEEENEGG